MPTFLGPGTLPTMEAMYINVPMILPNFAFNKDYYQKSCLYYEFHDPRDLAMRIIELDKSLEIRKMLLKESKLRYNFLMNESQISELINYLEKFNSIVSTYK